MYVDFNAKRMSYELSFTWGKMRLIHRREDSISDSSEKIATEARGEDWYIYVFLVKREYSAVKHIFFA